MVSPPQGGGPTSCPSAQRGFGQTTKTNSARPGISGNRSGSTYERDTFLKLCEAWQEVLVLGPGVYKPHPGATRNTVSKLSGGGSNYLVLRLSFCLDEPNLYRIGPKGWKFYRNCRQRDCTLDHITSRFFWHLINPFSTLNIDWNSFSKSLETLLWY